MIEDTLRNIIGKRLIRAGGTFHVHNGRASAEPLAVWLVFDGMKAVRFAGASDGDHMIVDQAEPEEMDMHESGVIRFMDISEVPAVLHAVGNPVRAASVIVSPSPQDVIGARFDFDTCTMRILNWGDEIVVAAGFPEDAELQEIDERSVSA